MPIFVSAGGVNVLAGILFCINKVFNLSLCSILKLRAGSNITVGVCINVSSLFTIYQVLKFIHSSIYWLQEDHMKVTKFNC